MNAGAGRVAVVTGAAGGIGQAIALRLAEAGHAMTLAGVRPADVRPAGETEKQVTNGGGEALSVPCDLGAGEGVDLASRVPHAAQLPQARPGVGGLCRLSRRWR